LSLIRKTQPEDAIFLPDIEKSAGAVFRSVPDLAWIADDDVMSSDQHLPLIYAGTSWVAEDDGGDIVGFLSAEQVANALHIWEISVLEKLQGQGIGRALIKTADAFARAQGLNEVTLTTFRKLTWNELFYQRLGFETLDLNTIDDRLRHVLENELAHGLPGNRRCAMRRVID
jgi:GNAT superfamily N-acetyltransferase